jgi:hypothetical protein
MKASSKRRRTRTEIQEAKRKDQVDKLAVEAKLQRLAQLE